MNSEFHIRKAKDSDIAAITDIYAHHVLHGTGSFEIDPPDAEEMARRMADVVGRGLPYFVADTSTPSLAALPSPPRQGEKRHSRPQRGGDGAEGAEGVLGTTVIGYAYATLYRTRIAYRFTLEDLVYIYHAHVGQGVGAALLGELIAACREWGCRQLVAVIGDSENKGSVRVHEKLGFEHAGVLREVGFKFDRWIDTVFMQLRL